MLSNNAPLINEMKNLTLIFTLLVIYLFLIVPYIVRVKLDQIIQVEYLFLNFLIFNFLFDFTIR